MNDVETMAIAEMRIEIRALRRLVAHAECPNCDGSGGTPVQVGDNDWEQKQCQWCDERSKLIGDK